MSQPAEEPPRKRQRVTQACHRCRRKKYKCDSERPTCSTCRTSNSECTYGTVAKRRGLQSGYVRAVEILWGLVFKKVAGSQVAINDLLVDLSTIINSGSNDASHNGDVSYRADDLLECWRNSGVPSAIELMLDGTFTSNQVSLSEDMDSQVDTTLTSFHAWSLPQSEIPQGIPPRPLSPLQSTHGPSPTVDAVVSDAAGPLNDTFAANQMALPPLPTDWHSLTQIYFTVEHSWFPILERHTLFRIAYCYQDESDSLSALDDRQRGEFAILWAVLALGELHSSGVSSPRAVRLEAQSRYFLDKDPVKDDYATYAQAFLLWSMMHIGRNRLVLARSMLAQAFVFCTAASTENSGQQCAMTLSGCFVMDALLSLATDTRPLISADDLPRSAPCDEFGSDEWEPYVDRFRTQGPHESSSAGIPAVPSRVSSTYNHLVNLFCILNTAMQKQTVEHDLSPDLETWRTDLPRHLPMMKEPTQQTSKNVLPPQLHLRAFYYVVLYVIGTRPLHGLPQIPSFIPQQEPLHNIAVALVQIGHHFGAQAMPASVSVLISLLSSKSSSTFLDYETTIPGIGDVINRYKALWGWEQAPDHQDQDSSGATMLDHSDRRTPSALTSQDPLHTAIQGGIPHGLPGAFDLGTGSGFPIEQAAIPAIFASGETKTAGVDLNLMTGSTFDDVAASGTDSMLADTPTQLLDYLALLQENER